MSSYSSSTSTIPDSAECFCCSGTTNSFRVIIHPHLGNFECSSPLRSMNLWYLSTPLLTLVRPLALVESLCSFNTTNLNFQTYLLLWSCFRKYCHHRHKHCLLLKEKYWLFYMIIQVLIWLSVFAKLCLFIGWTSFSWEFFLNDWTQVCACVWAHAASQWEVQVPSSDALWKSDLTFWTCWLLQARFGTRVKNN